jgi:23S rRNA (guanosine2251-2'-O)-methyltransferase
MTKLNSKQLRVSNPSEEEIKYIKRNPIYLVLDNIIDTYNIGSLFRLADAIAAEKIYLCGDTEYPPSSRIHKAAVGTEVWVPWTAVSSASQAVRELKQKKVQIIAIEQHPRSTSYKLLSTIVKFPCAIVVGNETAGIGSDVLKLADLIVELPMLGINKSFNVWGSAAVIAYKILESLPINEQSRVQIYE